MKSRERRTWVGLLCSLGSTVGMGFGCTPSDQFAPPPPAEVTVSLPIRHQVIEYKYYTGPSRAEKTVELRARVKGFLKERRFDEKPPVKKDQLLYVIDEEPCGDRRAEITSGSPVPGDHDQEEVDVDHPGRGLDLVRKCQEAIP